MYVTHTHLKTPFMWKLMLYCYKYYFLITVHKSEEGSQLQFDIIARLIGAEKTSAKFRFSASFRSTVKYSFLEAQVAGIQATVQQIREKNIGVILEKRDFSHLQENGVIEAIISIKEKLLSDGEEDYSRS